MPARAVLGSVVLALVLLGSTTPAQAVTGPSTLDAASAATPSLAAVQAGRPGQRGKARQKRVTRMLRIVKAQKGDPYQYGATGPNRFDCSGLVYFATHRADFLSVPRTSSQQGRFMRRVPRAAMRPGDFVFFTGGSGVYHVGVYTGRSKGRRMIVHAPGSGQRVKSAPIWTDRWFPGTLR